MQSSSPALRRAGVAVLAALICVVAAFLFSAYLSRHRTAGHDELQYLHVGWLMARGLRLYRDFVEDHAPFLFVILRSLVPDTGAPSMPLLDVITYVARAREVMAACGVMTLACIGWLVHRATRSLFGPLITVATLVGSWWVWNEALTRVRNDPPALSLFWLGAALLLSRSGQIRTRVLLAGTGMGLIVTAALWNPKMPFECLVLGGVYLWTLVDAHRVRGWRMLAAAVLPALAIIALAVTVIASVTSLREYLFFTFQYNQVIAEFIARDPALGASHFAGSKPFLHCDPAFKGVWPVLAIGAASAILFLPRIRRRVRNVDLRSYAIVYALVVAAAIDLRFVFSYPNLWPQYYLMWDIALAALYGMTAVAALELIREERWVASVQTVVAIVSTVLVVQSLPFGSGAPSWMPIKYMQKRLRPQETVWLSADVHPIGAYDASYYWFVFEIMLPVSMQYTGTHPSPLPRIRPEDLPICRAERGLDPRLRFVSASAVEALPETRRCFERMLADGRAVSTPIRGVWDLHPSPQAARPPAPPGSD